QRCETLKRSLAMRAHRVVNQLYSEMQVWMHRRRFSALMASGQALLIGGKLNLTALGRSMSSKSFVKHCIKRVDRLVGSMKLHAERLDVYPMMAMQVLGTESRPP